MISLSLSRQHGGSQDQRPLCREPDRLLSWPNPRYLARDTYCTISSRIEAEIKETYDQLSSRIAAYEPFSSLEKYQHILTMMFRFHHQIDPLYTDPVIRQMSLGLPEKGSAALILQDIADLGICRIPDVVAKPTLPGGLIQRLGWLYVVGLAQQGTKMLLEMAGQLQLDANLGASYLAEQAEGSNQHWRAFTDGLDQLDMSEVEEERLYSGARSALSFANKLLNDELIFP